MLFFPVFKSHWTLTNIGSGYLVTSEDDRYLLDGEVYELLIPLLDGRNTRADILNRLRGKIAASRIREVLAILEAEGFLTEGAGRSWTASDAFWEMAGTNPAFIAGRSQSVTVMAADTGLGESICRALNSLRIRVAADAPFRIVAVGDYVDPSLEKLNTEFLTAGIAWLMAKPYGRGHWIGPLLVPGRTACWYCLAHRLRENGWTRAASVAGLPTTSSATAAMIATEAAKWLLTGSNPTVEGQIRVINTATLEIEAHIVQRRPQCPACGDLRIASARRLTPRRGPVTRNPEATLRSLTSHVSPITGIVSKLIKQYDDSSLFVYEASQHQVMRRQRSGAMVLTRPLPVVGKGPTDDAARASCLGEAIERYSAQFHDDEPRMTATFRQLGDAALDPRSLMLFSDDQYRRRDWWNSRHSGFQHIPERFDDNAAIEWVKIWSLTRKRFRYAPAAYCLLGYSESFYEADTNGCAAGNTMEEAVLHGLLELVERDATALWWYNRARKRAVDIGSFESAQLNAIVNSFGSQNRSIHVMDITSDIGIPVIAAVSATARGHRILFGTAAHPDPASAIVAALCELQQCICAFGVSPRASADPIQRAIARWVRTATLDNQSWLLPRGRSKKAADYATAGSQTRNVQECVRSVERAGLEVLALDMTRPDIGFPVVRVIVPGLRQQWARLAPGRLYEVPVKLGWRKKPVNESQMNPVPYFL